MVNLGYIARNILQERGRRMGFVTLHGMKKMLGESGYAAAREQKWLLPDIETGELYITPLTLPMRKIVEDSATVGDEVSVVDGGKTYTGIIQNETPEGYTLSFQGDKPAVDRIYHPGEVLRAAGNTPAAPAPPAVPDRTPITTSTVPASSIAPAKSASFAN